MTGEETPFTHDATSCSEEWNWWTEASTAHGEREDSCRQSWSTKTKRATSESASRSSIGLQQLAALLQMLRVEHPQGRGLGASLHQRLPRPLDGVDHRAHDLLHQREDLLHEGGLERGGNDLGGVEHGVDDVDEEEDERGVLSLPLVVLLAEGVELLVEEDDRSYSHGSVLAATVDVSA